VRSTEPLAIGNGPAGRCPWLRTDGGWTGTAPDGSSTRSPAAPGSARPLRLTRFATRSLPPLDAGVPLRDVQEAASHADPRTTRRHDCARGIPDRHATYCRRLRRGRRQVTVRLEFPNRLAATAARRQLTPDAGMCHGLRPQPAREPPLCTLLESDSLAIVLAHSEQFVRVVVFDSNPTGVSAVAPDLAGHAARGFDGGGDQAGTVLPRARSRAWSRLRAMPWA
jgi:hypothetical protein